ncbi:MAG: YraN family protein [Dehalococcoidia bacterium]|nr:YraN family protein [Dehalococcoidia bacterium]
MTRKATGALGERLAANFLNQHGYRIIENNFRCREGEIDIIAVKNDCLVFVEVRAKRSRLFGTPEESITATKKKHLRAAAERYRQAHNGLPTEWRIDVVAVELDRSGKVQRLEIIENAVEDEEG